ncbi:MAG: hypothetical protein JO110_29175 [Acetobacteraceae bacterium]|nr:hypothetical protein [Acetobacteraceae bacterium]
MAAEFSFRHPWRDAEQIEGGGLRFGRLRVEREGVVLAVGERHGVRVKVASSASGDWKL